MNYEVKLTEQAIGQIEETVKYISRILQEPETARKWTDTLQFEIKKLDSMPSRYPLTEEEPWRTKGIHKMPVRNFLVYFFIPLTSCFSIFQVQVIRVGSPGSWPTRWMRRPSV